MQASSMDPRIQGWLRKLNDNPERTMTNARKGIQDDMIALSNLYDRLPDRCPPLKVLDIFLHHLVDSSPPPPPVAGPNPGMDRAFFALLAIQKLPPNSIADAALRKRLLDAWPKMWSWMFALFSSVVVPAGVPLERVRAHSDALGGVLYRLAQDEALRARMARTPGTLEAATAIWQREDALPPSAVAHLPVCTAALGILLQGAGRGAVDRVYAACDGRHDAMARLALGRLRRSVARPGGTGGAAAAVYMDCINSLRRVPEHPIRNAFLAANVVHQMVKVVVAVAPDVQRRPELRDPMVAGLGYLYNCLDSLDGVSLVKQAIRAGLIPAYLDCSPTFSELDQEDLDIVLGLFKRIVPRYLVYRSVIQGVDAAMRKVEQEERSAKIINSAAKDVWHDFHQIAFERKMFLDMAKVSLNRNATCDNAKCQRIDEKKTFQECSACLSTFYCSKACQTQAWKEGDHKTMCKRKQRERLEGRGETVPDEDFKFLHNLSMRDARKHLPHLRALAQREHPGVPTGALVITIDYTRLPPVFGLRPLQTYQQEGVRGTEALAARNAALIAKVRAAPGTFTLLEAAVANGAAQTLVMTLATGGFWAADVGLNGGVRVADADDGEFADDAASGANVDEVDRMMGRVILDRIVRSFGEPGFPLPDEDMED